jgi:hypothetical protein
MSTFKSGEYLKLDEGMIRRLPKAFCYWQSKHAFRQFAGTKQKIIQAVYDGMRLDLLGSYIHFDAKGHWDKKLTHVAAVDVFDAADNTARAP